MQIDSGLRKATISSFFSGSTLPFLMAGIGAGIYLYQISKKRKDLEKLGNLGFLFISFSIITQIIFYSMNYFQFGHMQIFYNYHPIKSMKSTTPLVKINFLYYSKYQYLS